MPALRDIRTAICATISSAAGEAGRIYEFDPLSIGENDVRKAYESDGEIFGWHVRHIATDERRQSAGRRTIIHRWMVRAYRSLDDCAKSELDFDDLIESVRDAFREDITLGGAVATTIVEDQAGLQVEEAGPVMVAGVPCHSAKCRLSTQHFR